MSTATARYQCEACRAELRYHGGPHKPRWCEKHRPANYWKRPERHAAPNRRHKPVFCTGCETRLLRQCDSGMCLFCEIEMGISEPI